MIYVCQNINWELIINILIPSLLVIVGWYIVYLLNKRNEIAKEARSCRIKMLHSFMNLVFYIEKENDFYGPTPPDDWGDDPNILPSMSDWATVYIQIKMYGKADEIEQYGDIIHKVVGTTCNDDPERGVTNKQFQEIEEGMKKLEELCIKRLRKELKIKHEKYSTII